MLRRTPTQETKRGAAAVALLLAFTVAACSGPPGSASPSPSSRPTPITSPLPSGGVTLTAGDLRLELIGRFGPRWYCDPDEFPVAHGDEQTNADQRFAEVQADKALFAAILRHLHLSGTTFEPADRLAIYRLWKAAVSLPLDPVGNGRYHFDYTVRPTPPAVQGLRSVGTITDAGEILVDQQTPAGQPNCPICLALGTQIDGPDGGIQVEDLRIGDPVWTLDEHGRRVRGEVIAVGSTVAPATHHVIRLVLDDGRTVTASPGHPLADGRRLGDVRVGDLVAGSRVSSTELRGYGGGRTFDLLVSGSTGIYLSDGIPLQSTLRAG